MIVGPPRRHGISHGRQFVRQCLGILTDLLRIHLELGSHALLQLGGDACNLVLMRSSLQSGKDGLIDLGLKSAFVLTKEDHSRAGTAEGFVGGRGDDVAQIEWSRLFASRDKSRNVGHVAQEEGAIVVGNLAEFGIIPIAGVGRSSADDEGRLKGGCIVSELVVVNVAGFGVDAVGEGFEVDRGGGHSFTGLLLLGVGVESVGEMSATGEVESHDAIVRTEEAGVHRKVGRRAGVGLDVHAPLFRVESVGLEGSFLTERLNLIDHLVSSVVSSVGETLGVLVGQGRSEALHDCPGRKVLGRNELESRPLTVLLLLDQVIHFGIMLLEGDEAREFLILERRHGCSVFSQCVYYELSGKIQGVVLNAEREGGCQNDRSTCGESQARRAVFLLA
mmetsp:Transcript_28530/g.83979  ORF Transcript_28530/g.83979 Transcript_28530/m.83979 type:complete len:391 (-) Transcript_28530:12-1184(-)